MKDSVVLFERSDTSIVMKEIAFTGDDEVKEDFYILRDRYLDGIM